MEARAMNVSLVSVFVCETLCKHIKTKALCINTNFEINQAKASN